MRQLLVSNNGCYDDLLSGDFTALLELQAMNLFLLADLVSINKLNIITPAVACSWMVVLMCFLKAGDKLYYFCFICTAGIPQKQK